MPHMEISFVDDGEETVLFEEQEFEVCNLYLMRSFSSVHMASEEFL